MLTRIGNSENRQATMLMLHRTSPRKTSGCFPTSLKNSQKLCPHTSLLLKAICPSLDSAWVVTELSSAPSNQDYTNPFLPSLPWEIQQNLQIGALKGINSSLRILKTKERSTILLSWLEVDRLISCLASSRWEVMTNSRISCFVTTWRRLFLTLSTITFGRQGPVIITAFGTSLPLLVSTSTSMQNISTIDLHLQILTSFDFID